MAAHTEPGEALLRTLRAQAPLADSEDTRLGRQEPAQARCSVCFRQRWGILGLGLQPAVGTHLSVGPCPFLLWKLTLGHCHLRVPQWLWAHWAGLEDKAGKRMARQQNQILLTSQGGRASHTRSTCSPGHTRVHVHQDQA